jgi:hypothetical protein
MSAKITAVGAGAAAGTLLAKREDCGREDGREEGAAEPVEALRALLLVAGDRVASALWHLLANWHKCSQSGISQQTRQATGGVSVICTKQSKRLTFVGQDSVGHDIARHGLQDAL